MNPNAGSIVLALAFAALQPARAADWKMAPAGSRLEFAAQFEKTPAPGIFKDFDVRLGLDGDSPAGGRLDVTIRVASADMASADINKAIAGAEWFDVARYPVAEFHATEIRRAPAGSPAGRFIARGTLALKGVTQPLEVPLAWTAAAGGATLDGEFSVKRSLFGIGTGEWAATSVIGADVNVKFHVQLREAR
ncbi:YceI family protein [Variovorax ginsengisoli]|jgi:polyisoprenoid-binding protein YceI|uniref:YceI family protein n=1 Tax=Variovorax ginsengisoli TaxID=363844 RepID=A0ABT8S0S4_9BURK|nr:YceI family protein [Variovorax ginsengisoli]MDN8613359.1 YceI family protein [Variovorax ginsengisoli]MDO1532529.1 YceI family protein [Variovorax ginsengisoli]